MSNPNLDAVVYDFYSTETSGVVLLSTDALFLKMLRGTAKMLGVRRECVWVEHSPEVAAKLLAGRRQRRQPTVLFMELELEGHRMTSFLVTVKAMWPELKIVALVGESRREDIAHLYESGADNVIAKPASVNNIIEKLALTLKPQGKLSELVGQAKDALSRGQLDVTQDICRKVLQLKPGSPTANMLLGDAFLAGGDEERALDAYLEASRNAPLFMEPLKRLAEFFREREHDKYLNYLKKLDKLSPLNAERKRDIGAAHFHRGENDKAMAYFDEAIACATREAAALIENITTGIAEIVGEQSPELAEKYLVKVLEGKADRLTRQDIETFNRLGIALKKQGKWQTAVEYYQKALAVAQDDEGLHYNLGLALAEGGRHAEASRRFEQALRLNPKFYQDRPSVTRNLATTFLAVRDAARSRLLLEHLLELKPDDADAKASLARLDQETR